MLQPLHCTCTSPRTGQNNENSCVAGWPPQPDLQRMAAADRIDLQGSPRRHACLANTIPRPGEVGLASTNRPESGWLPIPGNWTPARSTRTESDRAVVGHGAPWRRMNTGVVRTVRGNDWRAGQSRPQSALLVDRVGRWTEQGQERIRQQNKVETPCEAGSYSTG